jgi:hypothetical protein
MPKISRDPQPKRKRTMSTAQTAEMVRDRVQVVTVRGYLQTRVFGGVRLRARAVDARWERWKHVVGQV